MADKPTNYIQLNLIQRNVPTEQTEAAQKKAQDRENGRLLAQQHAEEALQATLLAMRAGVTAKDWPTVLKASKQLMDRAWGTPKTEDNSSQVLTNRSILEVLAGISMEISNSQDQQAVDAKRISQDAAVEAEFSEVPGNERETVTIPRGTGAGAAGDDPNDEIWDEPDGLPAGEPSA